jgi:hypothetical protein
MEDEIMLFFFEKYFNFFILKFLMLSDSHEIEDEIMLTYC